MGFILLLALVLAAGGRGVPALAAEKPFVAVIITGDLGRYREAHEAFVEKLHAQGYGEQNLTLYVQTPNPDTMSWINSIRKAVGIGADVIVTYGAPATLSAKRESRGVPIIFADVYDPVGLGLICEIGIPAKNIAGVSSKTPIETLIKTFREISPAKTMGVLYSSIDEGSLLQLRKLEKVAEKLAIATIAVDVTSPKQMETAFSALAGRIDSLFVTDCAVLALKLKDIVDFANAQQLPVVSQVPTLCDLGALITLEADPIEQGEVAANLLVSLFAGIPTTRMELHTPRKVNLVINLKVARSLKLKVPFQALSVATRVVR
ncbi:MAG: ABC transporter substrate-binding protein [Desulfuromonadaceae bacterium]